MSTRHLCFIALLPLALVVPGAARAQSGSFVIPGIRAGGGTDFAFWDWFARPPGSPTNVNYNYANPPALLDGLGLDDDGNPTTAFVSRTHLKQTGASNCFVTSSGAIYSFNSTAAFEVPYQAPASPATEITNVIFQTQTGGSRLDLNSVKLRYTAGVQTFDLAPLYRALDDPQSGEFSERLVCGFQWNLTGLNVRTFKVLFAAPGPSMPIWQAQLDVKVGAPFVQELGYILQTSALPLTRYGRPGSVDKNVPFGVDDRFFFQGEALEVYGVPELDWEPVGWLYDGQAYDTIPFNFLFPAHDAAVTALFAPLSYDAWREMMFDHANALTGTVDDYLDDAVSAPDVDHDHDGLSNAAEYAFGCDPYAPDAARAQPQMLVATVGGIAYPAIRYRTNGAPEDYGDIVYRAEVSTTLGSWTHNGIAPTTAVVGRVLQPDGSALITERALQPLSAFSRCFMRVRVEEAP